MPPWHFTTWLDFFDHWQTLITGFLAGGAAVATIWVTRSTASEQIHTSRVTASEQIKASREQAEKMVEAAREQTSVTAEQTSKTIYLARMRDEAEARAFRVMLEAAVARVIDEVPLARTAVSVDTPTSRACITKGGFDELRGGCLRLGSPLTGEFLDLEREIDNFALGIWDRDLGLKKLDLIETKATTLRDKAARPPSRVSGATGHG